MAACQACPTGPHSITHTGTRAHGSQAPWHPMAACQALSSSNPRRTHTRRGCADQYQRQQQPQFSVHHRDMRSAYDRRQTRQTATATRSAATQRGRSYSAKESLTNWKSHGQASHPGSHAKVAGFNARERQTPPCQMPCNPFPPTDAYTRLASRCKRTSAPLPKEPQMNMYNEQTEPRAAHLPATEENRGGCTTTSTHVRSPPYTPHTVSRVLRVPPYTR